MPAWTADCYYYEEGGISKDCTPNIVSFGEVWTDESKETIFSSYVDIPCWSVGRLLEISIICQIGDKAPIEMYINKYSFNPSLVENIINRLERLAELGVNEMDFSKLED